MLLILSAAVIAFGLAATFGFTYLGLYGPAAFAAICLAIGCGSAAALLETPDEKR